MKFEVEKDRIYARDNHGFLVAEVTFPTVGNVSTINHTFVDPSLRGKGVADRLVSLAVDKILAAGHKVAATCSYARMWLQRHPLKPAQMAV